MTDINIKLHKNFIQDLSGIDNNGTRITDIIGFYVIGLAGRSTDNENTSVLFYKGKASFVNLDNKSEKLITNLYTSNSESIAQGSNFRKLLYLYETIHEGEFVYTDLSKMKYETEYKNSITYLDLTKALGSNLKIAFEIESKNNNNMLSALNAYEAFRPQIDLHNFKIFTNLISIDPISENKISHIHDYDSKEFIQEISETTTNQLGYKEYSINSVITFKNEIKPTTIVNSEDTCYEDWNFLNLVIPEID